MSTEMLLLKNDKKIDYLKKLWLKPKCKRYVYHLIRLLQNLDQLSDGLYTELLSHPEIKPMVAYAENERIKEEKRDNGKVIS